MAAKGKIVALTLLGIFAGALAGCGLGLLAGLVVGAVSGPIFAIRLARQPSPPA